MNFNDKNFKYATSFKKKGSDVLRVRGTKVSFQNSQLLTSTGLPTLDFYLGGGLAIGTICLIEEDYFQTYSNLVLKYFLAEGVANCHSLFLASADVPTIKVLEQLPANKTIKNSIVEKQLLPDDSLKIAWRYKGKTVIDANEGIYTHSHILSKLLSTEDIDVDNVVIWSPQEHCHSDNHEKSVLLSNPYSHLLQEIEQELEQRNLKVSSKSCNNIMRICISTIGSPLWTCNDEDQGLHVIRFLYALKSLLRSSFAAAMVTVPAAFLQDAALRSRLRQMADTVIHLEPFIGSNQKTNPLFKDFLGLLHVVKLPVLNTFVHQVPATDVAFKITLKGFTIERLHLPPELEDPNSSDQVFSGCGGQPSRLDF